MPTLQDKLAESLSVLKKLQNEGIVAIQTKNITRILVRTPKGGNKPIDLLHETSIMDVRLNLPDRNDMEIKENIRMMTLTAALISCAPGYYSNNVMLASGGYPWTVIPLETRNEYMATLEEASVNLKGS